MSLFSVDKKFRGIKDLGPEMIFETKNSRNGQPGYKTKRGQQKPDVKATSVLLRSPVKCTCVFLPGPGANFSFNVICLLLSFEVHYFVDN